MMDYVFTTRQGSTILLQIRNNTRKNIIVRSQTNGRLRLSIPKTFTRQALHQWLTEHEQLLMRCWRQQQQLSAERITKIWFKGQDYDYVISSVYTQVRWTDVGFVLPLSVNKQQSFQQLKGWLQQQAPDYLFARLRYWAQELNLQPVNIQLTSARTLWGVCRPQRGIRLNWRLIGAPLWVVDYVCIHELCHLTHLNHSRAFWQLVNSYTPHTQSARAWLKQHGAALFIPD